MLQRFSRLKVVFPSIGFFSLWFNEANPRKIKDKTFFVANLCFLQAGPWCLWMEKCRVWTTQQHIFVHSFSIHFYKSFAYQYLKGPTEFSEALSPKIYSLERNWNQMRNLIIMQRWCHPVKSDLKNGNWTNNYFSHMTKMLCYQLKLYSLYWSIVSVCHKHQL